MRAHTHGRAHHGARARRLHPPLSDSTTHAHTLQHPPTTDARRPCHTLRATTARVASAHWSAMRRDNTNTPHGHTRKCPPNTMATPQRRTRAAQPPPRGRRTPAWAHASTPQPPPTTLTHVLPVAPPSAQGSPPRGAPYSLRRDVCAHRGKLPRLPAMRHHGRAAVRTWCCRCLRLNNRNAGCPPCLAARESAHHGGFCFAGPISARHSVVSVCVCVCACACKCQCVRACVCVCAWWQTSTRCVSRPASLTTPRKGQNDKSIRVSHLMCKIRQQNDRTFETVSSFVFPILFLLTFLLSRHPPT